MVEARLHDHDRVGGANLPACATLVAARLGDQVGTAGFADNGVTGTNRQAGAAPVAQHRVNHEGNERTAGPRGAASVARVRQILVAKVAQAGEHQIADLASAFATRGVFQQPGKVLQQLYGLLFTLAASDLIQQLQQALGAEPARNASATRFTLQQSDRRIRAFHHASVVIEYGELA